MSKDGAIKKYTDERLATEVYEAAQVLNVAMARAARHQIEVCIEVDTLDMSTLDSRKVGMAEVFVTCKRWLV